MRPAAVPAPPAPPPKPRPTRFEAHRAKDGKALAGKIGDYATQPTAEALRPHGPGEFVILGFGRDGTELGERLTATVHANGTVEFKRA